MLRRPPSLVKGDQIGVLSTARAIDKNELHFALDLIQSWGLIPVLGQSIGVRDNQFAGNDEWRAKDLQEMLDNPAIKAIFCARGGYGTVRIMDYLDFSRFTQNPKWIVGYSDVTILHAHINNYLGIQTLHATMPINYQSNTSDSLNSLKKSLFGEGTIYQFDSHNLNRKGAIQGEILGGNLSILYSILGTKSGFNPDNKILFIEDLDEYLYHIDRMMMALKRAGKLSKLKALVVGAMSDMNDNTIPFGQSAEEIISAHCAEYNYPICFHAPIGHVNNNLSIQFGAEYALTIDNHQCKMQLLA